MRSPVPFGSICRHSKMTTELPLGVAMRFGPCNNISSELMRAFENRPACKVWDELQYGFYLARIGILHPGAEEIIATHGNDPDTLIAKDKRAIATTARVATGYVGLTWLLVVCIAPRFLVNNDYTPRQSKTVYPAAYHVMEDGEPEK